MPFTLREKLSRAEQAFEIGDYTGAETIHMLLLYGIPVAMFCSGEPEHTRDMGWLWERSAAFRMIIGALGLGMVAGALSVAPFGDTPLRTDWRWIPGTLGLFGSWFGLMIYLSKQLKKTEKK